MLGVSNVAALVVYIFRFSPTSWFRAPPLVAILAPECYQRLTLFAVCTCRPPETRLKCENGSDLNAGFWSSSPSPNWRFRTSQWSSYLSKALTSWWDKWGKPNSTFTWLHKLVWQYIRRQCEVGDVLFCKSAFWISAWEFSLVCPLLCRIRCWRREFFDILPIHCCYEWPHEVFAQHECVKFILVVIINALK